MLHKSDLVLRISRILIISTRACSPNCNETKSNADPTVRFLRLHLRRSQTKSLLQLDVFGIAKLQEQDPFWATLTLIIKKNAKYEFVFKSYTKTYE